MKLQVNFFLSKQLYLNSSSKVCFIKKSGFVLNVTQNILRLSREIIHLFLAVSRSSSGKYVPRAVLLDLEPGTMEAVHLIDIHKIYNIKSFTINA